MNIDGTLWRELGETMRNVRTNRGVSLRQLEQMARWRRGTLSQVENGKLRPSHELVRFYDATFEADGLLTSLYAEAHIVHPPSVAAQQARLERFVPGDAIELLECSVPTGTVVSPSAAVYVRWKVRNAGSVMWERRALRRVGAAAGSRLISSAPSCLVPQALPGETVEVACVFAAPGRSGTVVANWRMVHADGAYCFADTVVQSVLIIVG